ncbi:hypothetical protein [Ancylobacter oerskovii]|uniref:Uncharacterized protein n=1 Tax=Ancylobacter oerskovii TaxID=459519 RepID=A0ABW4Z2R7_9HYPH|nr:hypothetical protein [Ancylobacter oerskovii]MBS7546228.1 hypothetical protein [Ancylobacter oerskovii]
MHSGSNSPVYYLGALYDSRIDAIWAAFFDNLSWSYEYKPSGPRGWAPTFALRGAGTVLVGVEQELQPTPKARLLASRSVRDAGGRSDILLLGIGLVHSEYWGLALGALGECSGDYYCWGDALPHSGGGIGFCHSLGSFRNRITGYHDGDRGAGDGEDLFAGAWRSAQRAPLLDCQAVAAAPIWGR